MTQIPFYGFAVACIDDPDVQTLIAKITDRRIISYGVNPQADVRLTDLTFDGGSAKFNVVISGRSSGERRELNQMLLPMGSSDQLAFLVSEPGNSWGAVKVAKRE